MTVLSLRLHDREINRLTELSQSERKDKSSIARELIDYGWEFLMLRQYRMGKISVGTLAEKLELSISATIDLLAEFGITAPLDYDDYLQGLDVLPVRKVGDASERR
jgi:predicted HTH domain antitoxin